MKNNLIEDAKTEANETASKIIEQAQAAIEGEKKAAIAELKAQVSNLSIDIAEKIIRQELSDKDKQVALVESMLGEAKLN
jgi:F-type H+-transporting ATPase subunit b